MSVISCDCTSPSFPILGRPNCVVEMQAIAFPIFVPRFKADGTRNTIDVTSGTIGANLLALIQTTTADLERWYPSPKMENITFERTDTVYETAPSTKKYKIDGVGGVYTFKGELWAKEAIHSLLRELEAVGCSDIDVFFATVDGNIWGIKDNETDTVMRGYELATETFDAFKTFAMDTSTQKIMVSFDFENTEAMSASYVVTQTELGYNSKTLRALIPAYQVVTSASVTNLVSTIYTKANTANPGGVVKGLLAAAFTVTLDGVPSVPTTVTETPANSGIYVFVMPTMTATETALISVFSVLHDIDNGSVIV